DRDRHLRGPDLARAVAEIAEHAQIIGGTKLKVQTNVDHHARRAQRLAREETQLVAEVVEEPQLVHQSLGVEGPPLAVAAGPRFEAMKTTLAVRLDDGRRALEVVPRFPLVIPGGRVAPPRKRRGAQGRKPRGARS